MAKVFRFGQLFSFRFKKSFPFWQTGIECKVTKYIKTMYLFWGEIFAKNR